MAKTETENEVATNSENLKEPLVTVDAEMEKSDSNFRVPSINSRYKAVQKRIKRMKRSKIYPEVMCEEEIRRRKKLRRHMRKAVNVEKASDKNIATLLRSERLFEFIKRGWKIPYEIGRNISQKTGFKSVSDLNEYISINRKKFIVLVDRKERYCQNESSECNNTFRRTDSVELNLFFQHHYGDSIKPSTT